MKPLMLIIFLMMHAYSSAQELKKIKTIPLNLPSAGSVDRAGNIYIGDQKGNLNRFDAEGEFELTFSPPRPSKITSVEAWQGLRIFLFFKDLQEYTFLNRFLSNQGNYQFNPSVVGFVEAATPSSDNNIWLFDQTDFNLKKYDIILNEIVSRTPFDLLLDPDNYNIGMMKEYQNKLFIGDINTGVLVFDNLGNYLTKFSINGIEYFNFYEEELYFIKGDNLELINIYSKETRRLPLPPDQPWLFPLLSTNLYYLVSESEMGVFR